MDVRDDAGSPARQELGHAPVVRPCACCREPQAAGREICDACGGHVAGDLGPDDVPMECWILLPDGAVATHLAICRIRLASRLVPVDDVTLTLEGKSLESSVSTGFGRLSALSTEPAAQVKEEDLELAPTRPGNALLTVRVACTLPDGTSIACQAVINGFKVDSPNQVASRSVTVNVTNNEMADNRGLITGLEEAGREDPQSASAERDAWRRVALKRIPLQGDHKPCAYCGLLCDRQVAKCTLCAIEYPAWWKYPVEPDAARTEPPPALTGMVLWPVTGQGASQRHYLHFKQVLSLGRDFHNDVPVRLVPWGHRRNSEISSCSVRVGRVGERVAVERAGKSAVTINDTSLGEGSRFVDDVLVLGFGGLLQVEVRTSRTTEVRLPARTGVDWGAASPMAAVRITRLGEGQDVETHLMMPRWGILGSDDQADVRIRTAGVAAQHARLVVLDGVLHVTPIRDGVFVNDRKARPRFLTPIHPGARLRVGTVAYHALAHEPGPVKPDNEW